MFFVPLYTAHRRLIAEKVVEIVKLRSKVDSFLTRHASAQDETFLNLQRWMPSGLRDHGAKNLSHHPLPDHDYLGTRLDTHPLSLKISVTFETG